MIKYLLKNSEVSELLKFVSPKYAKVVQPTAVALLVSRLFKNSLDQNGFQSAYESLNTTCEPTPDRGQFVLKLYFQQIFGQTRWILDFRHASIGPAPQAGLCWKPRNVFFDPDPVFLDSCRGIYRGFYRKDDALFSRSLQTLGIAPIKNALLDHLGSGDQTAVTFELKTFQKTFEKVFESCAEQGLILHSDFLALGIMLLGLYENLETIGTPQNVAFAFQSAEESLEKV